jgi:hypothetical protein
MGPTEKAAYENAITARRILATVTRQVVIDEVEIATINTTQDLYLNMFPLADENSFFTGNVQFLTLTHKEMDYEDNHGVVEVDVEDDVYNEVVSFIGLITVFVGNEIITKPLALYNK